MTTRSALFSVMVLLFCLGMCACLPGDTRPPPGTLLVAATSDQPASDQAPGWLTEDGWSISYERFLVSLGDARLSGPTCQSYSDARYSRILDMHSPGQQKVSVLYALGPCMFNVSLLNASPDSVLGYDVTEQDRIFMSTPGAGPRGLVGFSLFVKGAAFRDGVRKTFAWSIRQFSHYPHCPLPLISIPRASDIPGAWVTLRQEQVDTIDLRVHGEALFLDNLDPAQAMLRFDAFADADGKFGNDDGAITFDEFALVPLADLQVMNRYRHEVQAGPIGWKTLGDYVFRGLVRNLVRIQSVQCSVAHSSETIP